MIEPWRYQLHVEVWVLLLAVVGMGLYVSRVLQPKAVAAGDPPITKRQKAWFVGGVLLLWVASDWPLHDISERYLYSLHMVQHLLLTFVMPPMFWLAIPSWLARLLVPPGTRSDTILRRVAKPIIAGLIYNGIVVFTHWSVVVNTSIRVGAFHYLVHLVVVTSAFVMWLPVCSPWKEHRLSPMGQCIYLFMMSILPTVPGAWLSLSGAPLYEVYDTMPRLWGISVLEDQQIAGLFMKVGGGAYLWAVIIAIFFRWGIGQQSSNRRGPEPASEPEPVLVAPQVRSGGQPRLSQP